MKKILILLGIFTLYQFGFSKDCSLEDNTGYREKYGKITYTGDYRLLMGKKNIEKSKNIDVFLVPVNKYEVSMDKVDVKTFEFFDGFFGRDNNYVYYAGKRLNNIDPKTFEVGSWNGWTANDEEYGPLYIRSFKDKNGWYNLEDIQNGKLKLGK